MGKTSNSDRETVHESWRKFLNPESLRSNLILASLYLAAYETLKNSIIDQIKSFFTFEKSAQQEGIDTKYAADVMSLDKSPLRASALWLERQCVIDAHDMAKLDAIRKHRNDIAHSLPRFVSTVESHVDLSLLQAILELVAKVDRWWLMEFEIPSNSDFDGKNIDSSNCQSGNMIFLGMLIRIATGKPEGAGEYLQQWEKLSNK